MLVCNLFLRAFMRGVSSLCDEMYLVIYFFVPSHEVYLHDVTSMYLVIYRFVWRLTFDCAQMCFPKRHPPCAGEVTCAFLFVHLHRRRACLVLRSATPPRSTFGDDDRGTCFCLSDDLIRDLLLISRRGSCLAFGFRATGLSTRRSSDGILLGDLRLISRRGSCLAFGFRAT